MPMAVSPSPVSPAWRISSRYGVLRKLGAVSMGAVYLVLDRRRDRPVALKVLRPDRIGPEGVARLQKEFRAIAALHHPQIAAAHDFGYTEDGRIPYYTREYIEGSPLPPGPPPPCEPRQF